MKPKMPEDSVDELHLDSAQLKQQEERLKSELELVKAQLELLRLRDETNELKARTLYPSDGDTGEVRGEAAEVWANDSDQVEDQLERNRARMTSLLEMINS